MKRKISSVAIVPLFNIIQSKIDSNLYFMEKSKEFFNYLGINTKLYKLDRNVYEFFVKGIDNIYTNLFPLL